ncbi:MAG: manganese efflux pump MntP family protein [Candidatus Micrarchaeia archaeon]|jgi:putative Mn2+ efflux pump MntP
MDIAEIIVLSIGLAMDAMAVSITLGGQEDYKKQHKLFATAFLCGAFFGGFQALMPALGWLLGSGARQVVSGVDHWIAFILLSAIGLKMIYDSFFGKEDMNARALPNSIKTFTVLAVATSIDAFAAGVSLAFLEVPLLLAICAIGVVTFVLSFAGAYAGDRFGSMLGSRFNIVGGMVLLAIGLNILLSHLGIA